MMIYFSPSFCLSQKTAASILAKIEHKERTENTIPILTRYTLSVPTGSELGQSIADMTKLNVSYALETVLSMVCSNHLLADREYINTLAKTYLPALVSSNGFAFIMNHMTDTTAPLSTFVVDYATFMTQIVHHLLLPSLIYFESQITTTEEARHVLNELTKNPLIETVDQIFSSILQHIPILLNHFRNGHNNEMTNSSLATNENIQILLETILSLLLDLLQTRCKSFLQYLNPFTSFFHNDLTSVSVGIQDDIVIMEMTFLANAVAFDHYHNEIGMQIFTEDLISSIYEISLSHMTLVEEHLDCWSSDPEQFYIERCNTTTDNDIIASSTS